MRVWQCNASEARRRRRRKRKGTRDLQFSFHPQGPILPQFCSGTWVTNQPTAKQFVRVTMLCNGSAWVGRTPVSGGARPTCFDPSPVFFAPLWISRTRATTGEEKSALPMPLMQPGRKEKEKNSGKHLWTFLLFLFPKLSVGGTRRGVGGEWRKVNRQCRYRCITPPPSPLHPSDHKQPLTALCYTAAFPLLQCLFSRLICHGILPGKKNRKRKERKEAMTTKISGEDEGRLIVLPLFPTE